MIKLALVALLLIVPTLQQTEFPPEFPTEFPPGGFPTIPPTNIPPGTIPPNEIPPQRDIPPTNEGLPRVA